MSNSPIPEHVPAKLVRDFNYADIGENRDIDAHFAALHAGPDIFYSPQHGGHWVVTRFEDMDHVLSTPGDFSSRHQSLPVNPIVIPLLEYDGVRHAELRQVLAPFFSPRSISDLEGISRRLTTKLIEGFYTDGECEFVSQFSQRMPIMILMNLLALREEDRPYLLKISEDIVRSADPATQNAAFARVGEYIATQVLPDRIANPGGDIFSAMLSARVDGGRPLTNEEIVGFGTLLIAAGLDTVASMLGFIAKFLAEHPSHRRQIVEDPAIINDALEEMMRRFHISNISRVVAHDLEYKGVQMRAGDLVLVPTTAAGIDERRFKDPFTVNFARGDKRTLVFGRGPHQCIGSFLARTELRVFLQEWTKRIPDFAIKEGAEPIAVPGKANGMRWLPLVWDVA